MKSVEGGLVCFVTVSKRIRIEFAGIVLVESYRSGHRFRAYRVIETAAPPVYYLPQDDIQMAYLEPSQQTALCEWKPSTIGLASFTESANNLIAKG